MNFPMKLSSNFLRHRFYLLQRDPFLWFLYVQMVVSKERENLVKNCWLDFQMKSELWGEVERRRAKSIKLAKFKWLWNVAGGLKCDCKILLAEKENEMLSEFNDEFEFKGWKIRFLRYENITEMHFEVIFALKILKKLFLKRFLTNFYCTIL